MSEVFCCPECGLSLADPNPHYAEWAVQMHRVEEHGRTGDLWIEIHRGDGTWVRVTHLPTGERVTVNATKIGVFAARDRAVGLITRRLEKASNAT